MARYLSDMVEDVRIKEVGERVTEAGDPALYREVEALHKEAQRLLASVNRLRGKGRDFRFFDKRVEAAIRHAEDLVDRLGSAAYIVK